MQVLLKQECTFASYFFGKKLRISILFPKHFRAWKLDLVEVHKNDAPRNFETLCLPVAINRFVLIDLFWY